MADVILTALRSSRAGPELGQGQRMVPLGETVFRLETDQENFLVKWIADDDARGSHELRMNQQVLPRLGMPAPRLRHCLEAEGGQVGVWDWIDGTDLRDHNRNLLPEAFALLGAMHRRARYDRPVGSPCTRESYRTIRQLVQAELALHCPLFQAGEQLAARCRRELRVLEQGFATILHGDFHPGNLLLAGQRLVVADWAHCHFGLNLMDLDYVWSAEDTAPSARGWWMVRPSEAPAVLRAYFSSSGLQELDSTLVHRAVMVLAELRSHTNSHRNGVKHRDDVVLAGIERLLDGF